MRTIDGHTFDETLLRGGWVIDGGCRGWEFTNAILKRNYLLDDFNVRLRIPPGMEKFNKVPSKVYAVDIENFFHTSGIMPSELVCPPSWEQFKFKQAALTNYTGQVDAYFFGDGTGNFIRPVNQAPGDTEDRPCKTEIVPTITLQDIYNEIGTDIDLLKLDIEGSEYFVLNDFEPIPKQITVETHQHCHEKMHEQYWPSILERLCRDYTLHLFNVEPRYMFLDCLFIRKDLI